MRSATDPLAAGFVSTLDHNFTCCPDISLVAGGLNLTLPGHQYIQAAGFFLVGDGIFQAERRSVRARRVLERENGVVANFIKQAKGFVEICLSLAGEADNDVRSNADRAFR